MGVTESDKVIPQPVIGHGKDKKVLPLDKLLEHLAHNEVSDENLWLLRDYCSTINRRYENNVLFGKHLDYFNNTFGFSPKTIAFRIQEAYDKELLPPYISPSNDNTERMDLIIDLIGNIPAGFSKETAQSFIDNFEQYLNDNKDSIEALRIIYNSEYVVITHSMLVELRDSLLSESRQYSPYQIWRNYKVIDEFGNVDELDMKANFNALTNLIQIVRFAYHKNQKLTTLIKGYTQRFNLYCGQAQRTLSNDQIEIMRQIAEFVINDGAITAMELNEIDTDLWRRGITSFTAPVFQKTESALLSKVWNIANVLSAAGVGFTDYITQLTYILFLKMDDEKESMGLKSYLPEGCKWKDLSSLSGDDLRYDLYKGYQQAVPSRYAQKGH